MRIKLLTGAVVKGHPGVVVGQVFECNDAAARELLSMRIAELVETVEPVQTREPVIENRDPVIERTTKRGKKSLP